MQFLKKISSVAIACFTAIAAHAQMCAISGKITDAKTQEPLPGASVFLNNSTIGALSNSKGDFVLGSVRQPASYELVISLIGYTPYKTKLDLSTDELNIGTLRRQKGSWL